jgi:hypothetical protein
MLKVVRHAAGLAGSAVTRWSRLRDDAHALEELETRAPRLPVGLEMEWLGVSGYRLTYETRTIYVRIAELEGEVGRISRDARVHALPRLKRLAG